MHVWRHNLSVSLALTAVCAVACGGASTNSAEELPAVDPGLPLSPCTLEVDLGSPDPLAEQLVAAVGERDLDEIEQQGQGLWRALHRQVGQGLRDGIETPAPSTVHDDPTTSVVEETERLEEDERDERDERSELAREYREFVQRFVETPNPLLRVGDTRFYLGEDWAAVLVAAAVERGELDRARFWLETAGAPDPRAPHASACLVRLDLRTDPSAIATYVDRLDWSAAPLIEFLSFVSTEANADHQE